MDDRVPLLSEDDSDLSDRTIEAGDSLGRKPRNQSHGHESLEAQSRTRTRTAHTIISNSSKLKIVLLGKTGAGKSATGNTILARRAFRDKNSPIGITKTCQKEEVMVDAKELLVIDTPGIFDKSITEEHLRSEIENCVSMSAPGPHVFLLVISLDVRVTEEEIRTVKWIQENFGEGAARYTIVLFTRADQLDSSLNEYIRASNDLQALINKCGGRYHSFNNKDMENRSQFIELLEKIEKMVNENGGKHYTNEMFQEAQRKILKKMFWSEEPIFFLLGKSGSGKTATRKNILRKECDSPNLPTTTCEEHNAIVNEKKIGMIDTPELFNTSVNIRAVIERFVGVSSPFVFLLVIKLDDQSKQEKTVKWIQKNFGEDAARYTIILFTHADRLKRTSLDHYIRGSSDLQALIYRCEGRFLSFNNKKMENRSQVTQLLEMIEEIVVENGGKHYTKVMFDEAQRKIEREKFWSSKPRMVLVGKTGSGKTATSKNFVRQDCKSPNSATKTCKKHVAMVDGKNITIIDTPGLFDTTKKLKSEIENCIYLCAPGPHVFLLVIRVGAGITEEEKKAARLIQEMIGEDVVNFTVILFTHVDKLRGKTLDEYIRKSSALQALVNSCGGRYHSINNQDRENQNQISELLKKIENMAARNEWKHCTNEKLKTIINGKIRIEQIKAALSTGPGIAAAVAGTVALIVTEVVIGPAVVVALGLGATALFIFKKSKEFNAKRG